MEQAALTQTNLHFKRLTPLEATAYLVGTNVGAAILALPFAARHTGYLGAAVVCCLATFFSLVSHLFIVEAMLRTPAVTQLVGLFRNYLFRGRAGALYLWFIFVITIGVAIPSLTAYVLGGAEALRAVFGLSLPLAQALFLVLGAAVVWLGLKATGYVQKFASAFMGLFLILLTVLSFRSEQADPSRLLRFDPGAVWPVLPIAVFTCLSMATVPEVVRGLAHIPRRIPGVITRSLLINLAFCLVVPLAIFTLVPAGRIAEVASVSWGNALGSIGLVLANLLAFFALLTSFWGSAGTILTNVVDLLRFPSEWHPGYRIIAFAITVAPSVAIILGRFLGFVALVQMAGAVGGVLLALLPIAVFWRARREGARQPEYTVPGWFGWPVQAAMILFYLGTLIYTALAR
ncbi:MAG: aromatic amino acid transport family protein [Patescibacteria group bacterium]